MDLKLMPDVRNAIEFFVTRRQTLGSDLLAVLLFGSHVRGQASPDSDIDIFILVEKRTPDIKTAISDAAFDTNLAFELFIEPCVYGKDEFHNPILQKTPFLRNIMQEGVAV